MGHKVGGGRRCDRGGIRARLSVGSATQDRWSSSEPARQASVLAKRTDTPRTCSFCSRCEDDEWTQLVAGPGDLAICHACVHLCVQVVEDGPPAPSRVQQATLVLEDGSKQVIAAGLREAVSMLGRDDSSIVAFDLVEGGRLAVRRQAVRQIRAVTEPAAERAERPTWAGRACDSDSL